MDVLADDEQARVALQRLAVRASSASGWLVVRGVEVSFIARP
jgi:hypothetical protein